MPSAIPLTWEQVAAWRVRKQHLIKRVPAKQMLDMVSSIFSVQAQLMSAAEQTIYARVDGIKPADVQQALWEDRTLVKTWAMRGTIHLITAEDLPLYVGAFKIRKSYFQPQWLNYNKMTLDEMKAIISGVHDALDGRSLSREELAVEVERITGSQHIGELMRSGWGSLLKPVAFQGSLCFGPSQGNTVRFVRPDQWIKNWREVDTAEALQTLLRRFLGVYGPSTKDEFARWMGIEPRDSKQVFTELADELVDVTVDGAKGSALAADLDDIQKARTTPVVRLLPNFDQYTLGFYRQPGYLPTVEHKERILRPGAWISPIVMVDGRIDGIWKSDKKGKQINLTVELFQGTQKELADSIAEEAERLSKILDTPVELEFGSV